MNDTKNILELMLETDTFSHWLGVEVDEYSEGYCKLHYTIRADMLNGFSMVHGGIIFSGADCAFAYACNSHGQISVALDVHISFIRAVKEGAVLTVEASEIHTGNKTSFYNITTTDEHGKIISMFKGTAYRTGKNVYEAGNSTDQ